MCRSRVGEPSGFRVFGFVGALGVFFQYTTPLSQKRSDRQLALHRQLRSGRVAPMPPASTNKEIKLALLECWQDELESLQSLATSDDSGHDELPPLVASSDEDDDWEEEDDEDDAWGSPPSSPRVTPALIARLGDWVASSAQLAKPPRPIFRRILPVFG